MVLDGTITNLGTVVQGTECLVDVVTLHMDGTAVDAATFKGAMSIVYETRDTVSARGCGMRSSSV